MKSSNWFRFTIVSTAVVAAFAACTEPTVPTTLTLDATAVSFDAIGATQQLTATVKDQHGSTITNPTVTWTSSNAGVATVSSTGLVTAAGAGTAQIQAADGSATAVAAVTVTQVPAALVKVSGDQQTGTVGQPLSAPVTAQVNDRLVNPIVGATVSFSVTLGGGSVGTANATTGANGRASSTWTLGTIAGSNLQVTASAAGTAPVTFSATATAGAAVAIAAVSGNNQQGPVNTALPNPIVVLVKDQFSNGVSGVTVNFSVTAGGGSVNPTQATSGADGQAQTTWTLGSAAATQTMQASATGLTGSPVSFTATLVAGAPASVAVQAGDNQTAPAGTPVPIAPAVVVRDAFSFPVPNVSVTFAATSGGGIRTGGSTQTNASGVATVGSWTLGGAGTNTLRATVAGLGITGNPVTFTATAQASGAPASVAVNAGDNQTGLTAFALNVPPSVKVLDGSGNPVGGATVNFVVGSGGGSVTGGSATTSVFGIAQVGSWSVMLGANSLIASVTGSGITGNPVTFNATGVNGTFNIDVRFLTPMTAAETQAFTDARNRWQTLIYGDIPDIPTGSIDAGQCGTNSPAVNETIDDVVIFASIDSIDGPGRILGQAGPCYIRVPGFLPLIGIMEFDSADVGSLLSSGQFGQVVLHEMAHVLGFGTIWDSSLLNLLANPSQSGGTDPHFTGPQAIAAFDRIGAAGYTAGAKVPVENMGGAGTADGHWRESVFGAELMTGFLNSGVPNPLSVVTVASMGDEAYAVNYAGADAFSLSFPLRAGPARVIQLQNDIIRRPIYLVDRAGRVTGVLQPK